MAASKSYFPRPSCRFLPTDPSLVHDSMIFELDEPEVWNSTAAVAARSRSPKVSSRTKAMAGSVPVNVPDWSKILKEEYRENRGREESDDDYGGEEAAEEEEGNRIRIPPHEFLARNRVASSSVQEGIGRTLKGRDLSRVRNAVWQKIGFQD